MKVVVTGASGFVGSELIKELLHQKHDVIAVVRNKNLVKNIFSEEVRIIECPFEEYGLLSSKIDENIDVFFHFAWAGTSGDIRGNVEAQMKNVIFTKEAVEQAKACNCKRFVYAGSIMEYEAREYLSQNACKPGRGYIYSTAKLSADYIARIMTQDLKMRYVNVVISNIYGSGEKSQRFLNSIVRKMLAHETIELTEGKQLYDFIYISDAVRAIALAGCYGEQADIYYIGNQQQKPLRDFVEVAKETLSSNSKLKYGAITFNGPYLSYNEIDTSILKNEFDFEPTITFEAGIELLRREEK